MHRLFGSFVPAPGAAGLLFLRLVSGTALMHHGWSKIQHPFTWMDAFHPGMPGVLQALQALIEFGGGLALVLGLLTPLATAGIVVGMAAALAVVHLPMHHPFVSAGSGQPSYELALLYLAIALAVLLVGPGRYSVDYLLFRREESAPAVPQPVRERTLA